MTFLIIFVGSIGLGIGAWILIDAFTARQRESKGEGQRPSQVEDLLPFWIRPK